MLGRPYSLQSLVMVHTWDDMSSKELQRRYLEINQKDLLSITAPPAETETITVVGPFRGWRGLFDAAELRNAWLEIKQERTDWRLLTVYDKHKNERELFFSLKIPADDFLPAKVFLSRVIARS